MNQTRVRAFAPEITGAVVAVASLVAILFLSRTVGDLLHLHVSRRFIASACAAAVALMTSLTWLILVCVSHARATKTVIGFFREPVAPSKSVYRRGLFYFSGFEWSMAFALALFGFVPM